MPCSIKNYTDNSPVCIYSATPEGFDYARLNELGYRMTMTVEYDVHYVKDYKAWIGNIGYAGAPEYEVSLVNSQGSGRIEEHITATLDAKTGSITHIVAAINLVDEKYNLVFSTDNIQNTIYFNNVKISYRCTRVY